MDGNQVVGVVTRAILLKALALRLQTSGCSTMPALHSGQLIGLLTAENLGEFLMISGARNRRNVGATTLGDVRV